MGTKHAIQQKLANLMYKKDIYVNRGSKVPSFAFKCVFYRAEHNAKVDTMGLNLEGLEIKK